MMKKLNISELRSSKRFYLLSDFERRQFIGGGGPGSGTTWECTFNTFVSYMGSLGYNVDKNELINSYCSYSGTSTHEIIHDGGISSASFDAFISHAYQMNMTPQDSGPDSPDGTFPPNYLMYMNVDNTGEIHTVRPIQAITENGNIFVIVYDPTHQRTYRVPQSEITAFFTYDKQSVFGLPGYYGYPGDDNNPGYSGYSGYP